ncbi:response regulator [Mycolicibacterium mengxianglii]|uniref:response regulator n=1 Tax=Mycolicibacterium mengxianglii TaxID=2736649 RepID=UPI0018D0DC48|nr:response regulator [Mycolicibacterium mengxianglii]
MIRVLVVDDEPLIAEAHRQYLERLPGFVVHACVGTGSAAVRAVAAAAADGAPVDLVLLDIGLPDASGIDVASALNGIRPSPDIIAISSERDLEVVRSAVAHGVALYLLKPFTFAAFREKLERYQQYREALGAGGAAAGQHEIDRAMNALRTAEQRASTPKGVSADTIDLVLGAIRATPAGLNASEAAGAVGISRVTAWRYLERLADDGVVSRITEYGKAGRPQVRYRRA